MRVVELESKLLYESNRVFRSRSGLPAFHAGHRPLDGGSSLPHDLHLIVLLLRAYLNLLNQAPQESLAIAVHRGRGTPHGFQVSGKPSDRLRLLLAQPRLTPKPFPNLRAHRLKFFQPHIPTTFQFPGHHAVLRLDRGELPLGSLRFVLRLPARVDQVAREGNEIRLSSIS